MAFIEYKDLKVWSRIAVSALILITSIILLDLYLFKRDFYDQNPLYINVIIANFFSLPLFIITSIWCWTKVKTEKSHELAMYYGCGLSLLFLFGCTSFAWIQKWPFSKLMIWIYGLAVGLYIINFIIVQPRELKKQLQRVGWLKNKS